MNAPYTHTSHHKSTAKKTKEGSAPEPFLKNTLLAYLLSVAASLLLLLCGSLIAYFTADPDAYVLPFGLLVALLSAFLSGAIAIRIHKKHLLTVSLLNAALMMLTMLLLSFAFRAHATGYTVWLSALLHLGYFLISVFGAWILFPRTRISKKRKKTTKKR